MTEAMASYLTYAQCNVLFIVVLSILLVNILNKGSKSLILNQKLFVVIIILNIAILFFDTGTWIFNGETYNGASFLLRTSNFFYYIIQPAICFFWLTFVDYECFNDLPKLKKRLPYYAIPALIFIILTIVSQFTGWFYSFDELNVYHRGDFILIGLALSAIYLVVASVFSIRKANQTTARTLKRKYLTLFCYPVPVVVGVVLQFCFEGLSLIWVASAISVLIIFINLQNAQINKDYLTGVFNRRYLELMLSGLLNGKNKLKLYVLSLDIDDFKTINDTLGHLQGDDALISTADILSKACEKYKATVARFGGDEFFIVAECTEEEEIAELTKTINVGLDNFNQTGSHKYRLSVSYGVSSFEKDCITTSDSFIKLADVRMYENKEKRKRNTE